MCDSGENSPLPSLAFLPSFFANVACGLRHEGSEEEKYRQLSKSCAPSEASPEPEPISVRSLPFFPPRRLTWRQASIGRVDGRGRRERQTRRAAYATLGVSILAPKRDLAFGCIRLVLSLSMLLLPEISLSSWFR